MTMVRTVLRGLAFACTVVAAGASAQTLPLPANLISLASQTGEELFLESTARAAYWPLSLQFVTQKSQSFCGVATLVMVLNAREVPAPSEPGIEPFTAFTQDKVLNEQTERVLARSLLLTQDMTLDQFGGIAQTFGLKVSVTHAAASDVDHFRAAAAGALGTPGRYVVVNYLRKALGQERGGHISPLAAYDAKADRFLVLDVSRYKYPPVWVSTADLFAAMNTVDGVNEGQTRGFVLID